MKVLVGTVKQEQALLGTFSVIVKLLPSRRFVPSFINEAVMKIGPSNK